MPSPEGIPTIFRYTDSSDIPYVLVGSVFVIVAALGSPAQTFIYGKVFQKLARFLAGQYTDSEAFKKDTRYLCGLIISVGAIRMIFSWAGITGWLLVGERTQRRARTQLLASLLLRGTEWFLNQPNLVGSLTAVYRCIEEIRGGVSENMGLLVQTCASILFFLGLAMYALWALTLIVVAAFPLMGASSYVFGRLISRFAQQENRLCAGAAKVLDWCFAHPDAMRVLNGKRIEAKTFAALTDQSALKFRRLSAALNANSAILKFLGNLVVMAALLFGNFLVQRGKAQLGLIVTAFSACLLLATSVSSVADILLLLNKAHAACKTIDTLSCWGTEDVSDKFPEKPSFHGKDLDEQSRVADKQCVSIISTISDPFSGNSPMTKESYARSLSSLMEINPEILRSFWVRGVSYAYGDAGHVVRDVSADFHADRLNFIVGPSGCGKSTLACILAGFLQPATGHVEVGSANCWYAARDCVGLHITLVEPHAQVFSRSLRENLQLAAPGLTDAQFEEACEFFDLADLRGLPVLISENLSGGQLQKINLARAFVRNSPVLILDEAFGSINAAAKASILQRVRRWRSNTLTILVTHDLSEIQPHDHVTYMEDGRITDTLSHELCALPEACVPAAVSTMPVDRAPARDATYMHNPAVSRDLEHGGRFEPTKTVSASLPRLLQFWYSTLESKALVWVGLGGSLCAGIIPPVLSYCYSRCLSGIVAQGVAATINGAGADTAQIPGGNTNTLQKGPSSVTFWALIIVAVGVAEMGVEFAAKMSLDCAAEQWVVCLRKKCLHAINTQDMSFFHTLKLSDLNTLLLNDTRDLRHLVLEFLSGVLLVVSLTIVGLVWAVALGWKLALVGMAFIPLVLVVTVAYGIILQRYETAYKDAVAAAEKFALEVVVGIRTIHLYALVEPMARDFNGHLHTVYRYGVWRAVSGGFGVALQEFCTSAATGVVLYYGVALVGSGAYVQAQMILVLTMLTFTVTSASSMAQQLPEIARGQRAGTLIMQLVNLAESAAEQPASPVHMPSGALDVTLTDVSFAYTAPEPSQRLQVLRGVSLRIHAGETVAITGPSGCGKLTLAKIVSRLYVPDRGRVSVGGVDINRLDTREFRSAVCVDLQEPHFFEGSVWGNLTYGVEGPTEEAVWRCLEEANADFVDAATTGLGTIMNGGKGMSQGQLRRLSIARALLRQPKVLVFDEPTARMDSACREAFLRMVAQESTLRRRRPDLTVMVVTHDAEVMQQCGRVVVLDEGRVSMDGCFDTLVAQDRAFAEYIGTSA